MSHAFYVVAAVLLGACLSAQPAINAVAARVLGSALFATCISISISFVIIVALCLAWSRGVPNLTPVHNLPWWVILGGLIGVVFVAGSLTLAPVLGIAPFFVFVIAGQLAGSTAIDQLGAFGVRVRTVNPLRLLGLAMVFVGAALVQVTPE